MTSKATPLSSKSLVCLEASVIHFSTQRWSRKGTWCLREANSWAWGESVAPGPLSDLCVASKVGRRQQSHDSRTQVGGCAGRRSVADRGGRAGRGSHRRREIARCPRLRTPPPLAAPLRFSDSEPEASAAAVRRGALPTQDRPAGTGRFLSHPGDQRRARLSPFRDPKQCRVSAPRVRGRSATGPGAPSGVPDGAFRGVQGRSWGGTQ